MKIILDLNNPKKNILNISFFKAVVKNTLAKADFDFFKNKTIVISFAVVGENEIRKLNRAYLKKNEPTDVLSFPEFKNCKQMKKYKDNKVFLGEVILCYNNIEKYCQKNKINLKKETAEVVSHGVLHLLGFRHGKKMFELQENCSASKGLK
jgi:probable rRNA maturation factor